MFSSVCCSSSLVDVARRSKRVVARSNARLTHFLDLQPFGRLFEKESGDGEETSGRQRVAQRILTGRKVSDVPFRKRLTSISASNLHRLGMMHFTDDS